MLRPATLLSNLCIVFLLCQLIQPATANAADAQTSSVKAGYALVLASAPGKNLAWQPKKSGLFKNHKFYVERTTIKGKPWERLCLGFFDSKKQASAILSKAQKIYPGAWVKKASSRDISAVTQPASVTKKSPSIQTASQAKATATNSSSLSDKQLDSLMKRAQSDFKNKKYASAIRYFTALISAGNHKYSRQALELLGLSRQRKGQKNQAVKTYQDYLTRYPEGEDTDRVKQRLSGLLTATSSPRKKIRMSTLKEKNEIISYGSLSQQYRNNQTHLDNIGNVTTLSQLFSFIDLTTLQKTANFDHRYQFTGDHAKNFINDKDSQFRFIETYYELSYRKTGSSARIGRQTLRIGGVIRRFDGLSAGYQLTPDMRLNVLGGYPVDYDNKTSINDHKSFYGVTFETGTFARYWDMNLFYFDQTVDGLQDRQSLGTEIRYRDKRKSLFSMVDYDVFYNELNTLQLNANILFDYGRSVYMNAFRRKTPSLSISNALIGQQQQSIDELKKVMNTEQIYQLASDRIANTDTITIGGSQPVSKKSLVSADLTFFRIDNTIASGGVAATPDTGTDYYLSTQLVTNNLFMQYDSNILGIRYYETDPSNTISLIANSRFPVTRLWRVNPRLQFDSRQFKDGRSLKKVRAIFKTDYRYLNKVRFDFEIGYDKIIDSSDTDLLGNNNLFLMLGYRWDF